VARPRCTYPRLGPSCGIKPNGVISPPGSCDRDGERGGRPQRVLNLSTAESTRFRELAELIWRKVVKGRGGSRCGSCNDEDAVPSTQSRAVPTRGRPRRGPGLLGFYHLDQELTRSSPGRRGHQRRDNHLERKDGGGAHADGAGVTDRNRFSSRPSTRKIRDPGGPAVAARPQRITEPGRPAAWWSGMFI